MELSTPQLIGDIWWTSDRKGRWRWWDGTHWLSGDRPLGASSPPPLPSGGHLPVPAWMVAMLATAAVAVALVVADHQWLHVYAPKNASTERIAAATVSAPTKAEPDRVVAVLRECHLGTAAETGDRCSGRSDDHLHVTVKSAQGTTYEFDTAADHTVNTGDPWPP